MTVKHFPILILIVVLIVAHQSSAPATQPATTNTSAGWLKYPANPVLGRNLGTCFDISVLKEADTSRMWFSWRPKKSIAITDSKDGIKWSDPNIVLGPTSTGWEDDINRPVILKRDDTYHLWYTGQAKGHSSIGHAI